MPGLSIHARRFKAAGLAGNGWQAARAWAGGRQIKVFGPAFFKKLVGFGAKPQGLSRLRQTQEDRKTVQWTVFRKKPSSGFLGRIFDSQAFAKPPRNQAKACETSAATIPTTYLSVPTMKNSRPAKRCGYFFLKQFDNGPAVLPAELSFSVFSMHCKSTGMLTVRPKGRLISFSCCSSKFSKAMRTASTTKAEKVQSVSRMAVSTCSITSLGKRTDLLVLVGAFGIRFGDTKFSHALIHQPFQILPNYCNAGCMKSLHYIVHDMDVMHIRNAKPWDCIAGRGVLIWQ